MQKFFTQRSKSTNVYKTFWMENKTKKRSKAQSSRYSFRIKFKRKKKKNKHIRSKSMFFSFSTILEKPQSNFQNDPVRKQYIFDFFSGIRNSYVQRIRAIRRKVSSLVFFEFWFFFFEFFCRFVFRLSWFFFDYYSHFLLFNFQINFLFFLIIMLSF